MAYVNVAEWKTDQVCEWLKGLDNSVLPYVHSFTNHKVSGQQLLSLRPEDLEHLGVIKLGHQEIILEAVEYLRNFHYELDRENLQLLALRLSCQAHSLHNELSRETDSKPVTTQTLSDVASVIMAVKPLIRWLDRPPFSGQLEYNDNKADLMKLALEMATCAQRDRFAEKPIEEIRTICGQLAKLADYIIQDIADPMILQPASLDLATLKKKPGDDLGFYILPSFHGAHQIAEIKFGSAAHQCGKMEEGDEIVQVNYQTVVGWERKNLLELFRESPAEVLLTLKRRPRHTKVYGQIYIKPYRLPSNKKTSYTTRWQHNLPSPRPELLTIPDFTMPLPRHIPKNPSPEPASILSTANILDTMTIDSSDSDSEVEPPLSIRLYSAKPRNLVQRRATITGASPTTKHCVDIEQFWKELKQEHSTTFQLRDKAASCAHGLDNVPSNLRPQTCLGIEQSKKKKRMEGQGEDRKAQFLEKSIEAEGSHADDLVNNVKSESKGENTGESISIGNRSSSNEALQPDASVTKSNNLSDTTVPLDECNNFITNRCSVNKNMVNSKESSVGNTRERGKLDKSYSTPAYDTIDIDNREDRKLMLFEKSSCPLDSNANTSNNFVNIKSNIEVQCNVEDSESQKSETNNIDEQRNIHLNSGSHIAQKISNTEKHIRWNDGLDPTSTVSEQTTCGDIAHTNVDSVNYINGVEDNQSNNKCINTDPVNDCTDRCVGKTALQCDAYTHEKRDSNTSGTPTNYTENICSNGNLSDSNLDKIGKRGHNMNKGLIDHGKLKERESSNKNDAEKNDNEEEQLKKQKLITSNINMTQTDKRDNTDNIPEIQVNAKLQNDNAKMAPMNEGGNAAQPCRYVELTKVESVKKPNVKSYLTPPDPPPRRYYTKPATMDLSSDNISHSTEIQENQNLLEKRNARRNMKRLEFFTDSPSRSASSYQEKNDYFFMYNNFVDKSMDFIDEATSTEQEQKCNLISEPSMYGLSERSSKDEKQVCDKYEPFMEKFAYTNQSLTEYCNSEHYPRNIDSPDGLNYSRPAQSLELKSKTLDKDNKSFEKGVVNKAMMVARSIGLHGSLSKSSSSPRSSRKRNMLFARKRNVSVKDVGPGDLEGWLIYRSRGAGGAWARAWFVLKCSSLYRFKMQDSTKADCLIALTGFTVSQAAEVKSRKYAFKVYHTGTVFYFAADTEDCLTLWLDAINKATLGADGHNRNSALFSETDESDGEHKSKMRNSHTPEVKANTEKSFGSLKKVVRKDSGSKDHEISGASLDRKYLKFLGAKNQNVPVPTAQFRSYRRVLPTSTLSKKQDSTPSSPDLQMTIAGSTFYGLSASQSATDMSSNIQDMGDYRRTSDRCLSTRNRRPDDLQGFITLEEFMLSQQDEEQRQITRNRSVSPRITPLTSDHVHIQHKNFHEGGMAGEQNKTHTGDTLLSNDIIYIRGRKEDEVMNNGHLYGQLRAVENSHAEFAAQRNDNREESTKTSMRKKSLDSTYVQKRKMQENVNPQESRHCEQMHWRNVTNEHRQANSMYNNKPDVVQNHGPHMYTHRRQSSNSHDPYRMHDYCTSIMEDVKIVPKRLTRNDGYSGSSSDLSSHVSSETLQRAKKDASVCRKGSFNLTSRHEQFATERNWLDSLRRSDKKNVNCDKNRLKNVAQYQPPPMPTSPFEQEGMRAAFEMHLDKGEQVQKGNRFKTLFGAKCQQKPCTLDLPKESQKTLLGSPRLHRALFRDKCSNQSQQRLFARTSNQSQSPGDSGISHSVGTFSTNSPQNLSQSVSSASSVSDWSPDTPPSCTLNMSKCVAGHPSCQKGIGSFGRNLQMPPTLPCIPPPTSPPPDYPGLEYPPVFEPEQSVEEVALTG
ncbi:hypothetical protein KM043_007542 [Ampulex compressa]|nr:hypothetical protein KM043_007542 [Ampulex compressa]